MLRIRPYKASDADTILSWCQDEKTFYQWSAGTVSYTHLDVYKRQVEMRRQQYWLICGANSNQTALFVTNISIMMNAANTK